MDKARMQTDLQATVDEIRHRLGDPADLRIDRPGPDKLLIYLDGLVDRTRLGQLAEALADSDGRLQAELAETDRETSDLEQVLEELARGSALLLRREQGQGLHCAAISVPGWQQRAIEEPGSEQLIRGPREGFTETIAVNTAMIRRWINDPQLRVDELRVGRRTKTAVRLLYLNDVAAPKLVREVRRRLRAVVLDGVLESGYLEQLIADNRVTVFPLIQSTERSDKVAAAILEGRLAILVDKSPFTLIVPTTINELYQSPEDYYFNFYLGSFLRFFRLLGNNLAVAFSGLYVALSSGNPELLPTSFALSISASRQGIPYPISIEVLLLEIMVEIFREAGLRLPKNVNQTLGVVAGIGLALAAVQTHLVSGSSLVVVAIGAIASFSSPSFAVSIPWRIFKFLLILGAALLGIVGLTLTGIMILAHAATLTSFGSSYLAPWAPLQPRELGDAVIRGPFWLRFKRPRTYHPQEQQRMGNTRARDEDEDED